MKIVVIYKGKTSEIVETTIMNASIWNVKLWCMAVVVVF